MKKVQLVYAEVVNGITIPMLEDREVVIIYDNGSFLVTTVENSKKYNEEFYPVCAEGIEDYNLRFENGILISNDYF